PSFPPCLFFSILSVALGPNTKLESTRRINLWLAVTSGSRSLYKFTKKPTYFTPRMPLPGDFGGYSFDEVTKKVIPKKAQPLQA
ncbi:hypothetical protein IFR05_017386, partial [Cadophora sp. M221]